MQRFLDRVAVVTGASSGIGFATARALVREGAHVYLFARTEAGLSAARTELGARATAVQGDVSCAADLERLYAQVALEHGRVDVLFANAGIAEFRALEEADEQHYQRVFDANVRGAFYTVQKALPLLKPGAAIVLNTSVANSVGVPRTAIYAASKAAVRSFARTMAKELCERGIRINAVSPGPTESAIHAKYAQGMSEQALAEMGALTMSRLALGRMGKAEEVAAAVLFLASDEASFVLGQELAVDGGIAAL